MLSFKQLVQEGRGRFQRIAQNSKGFVLLESIMAITIFAALGTALMVGIRTANVSGDVVDEQSIAEKLARNQMEYVFIQAYLSPPASYVTLDLAQDVAFTVDAGFSLTAEAVAFTGDPTIITDTNIETVVVTVNRGSKTVLVLETLRTN